MYMSSTVEVPRLRRRPPPPSAEPQAPPPTGEKLSSFALMSALFLLLVLTAKASEAACDFTIIPCVTTRAPCCALFVSDANVGLRLVGDTSDALADQIGLSLQCTYEGTTYANGTLDRMCHADEADPDFTIPTRVGPLPGAE